MRRPARQFPDAKNPNTTSEGHQERNEAILSMTNSPHNAVPATASRSNPNQTPTSMSNSVRNPPATALPRIQLPIQSLHPA